ncbi:MAG: 1,6-anhydro-N-acetylmuramyl-L-alanine amidase AmpD [Alcanivoracaceae bacterium]|nr:1,6-anhydro-N-acetylmuramyl-L-alanine amidase AmpD [Alcanivoracaceae bacterium]
MFSITDHWVEQARKVPSPNYSERPDESDISLLVVHSISLPPNEFGGRWIDDFFCNQLDAAAHPYFCEIAALTVSSHFLIRRDGELVQYVPCNARAWHAGQSRWQGRDACNDFSIGVELEGADHVPYTESQYTVLNALIKTLQDAYQGIADNIVGHEHIAPGRKTDPGPAFDWSRLPANAIMSE